jgi:hypothetical protein
MNGNRFDDMTRSLAGLRSRRGLLRALGLALVPGRYVRRPARVDAARGKRCLAETNEAIVSVALRHAAQGHPERKGAEYTGGLLLPRVLGSWSAVDQDTW